MSEPDFPERTGCLIGGGGPAGIMLGLLLARDGVDVTVLEKHGDFLRDFRGDTVHASTLRLLDELGLGSRFAKIAHTDLSDYRLPIDEQRTILLGDFSAIKKPYDHIALAQQWDLLRMLADAAGEEPSFRLIMNATTLGPVIENHRVVGARVADAEGREHNVRASLTVACEGRDSPLRDGAGLVPKQHDVPYEVWWFRLSRTLAEQQQQPTLLPKIMPPDIMLAMAHQDYYQLAYLAPTGSSERFRGDGIESFRRRIARLRPDLADRLDELTSMDDLPLLRVSLNRLPRWHQPGLLCIGDAAHAMSPSGGVGINLAVQDAVAAARLLAPILAAGRTPSGDDLAAIRRNRLFPVAFLQAGQRLLHKVVYEPALAGRSGGFELFVIMMRLFPWLSRPLGRLIAIGPGAEHAPEFARREDSGAG